MFQTKRRKRILAVVIAILIAAALIAILFRAKSASFSESTIVECNDLVMGADGGGLYYMNVNKTGIFYIDNMLMKYSDYESGENYVLCDRVNCLHMSSDCGAYAYGMCALAAYDGRLYAFVDDQSRNAWDLIKMSMNGKERQVIASVDKGNYEEGQWYMNDFTGSVYYGYGKAYVSARYDYIYPEDPLKAEKSVVHENGKIKNQLLMIDLSDGETEVLAETEGMDLYTSAEFQLISEDRIIMTVESAPDAVIGRELEDAIIRGEMDWLKDALEKIPQSQRKDYWSEDMYDFYCDHEVYLTTEKTMSVWMYDRGLEKTEKLFQTRCGYWYDENGELYGWNTPYQCLGWYENGFLLTVEEEAKDSGPCHMEIKRWDFDTNEMEPVFEISDGGIPMMSFGTVGNYVLDDGKIMYMEYLSDGGKAQTYYYDLKGQKSVPLFEDIRNVTFRFLGETEDSFVGDMVAGEEHAAYIIRKEDYYSGNLQAARKLITDEE